MNNKEKLYLIKASQTTQGLPPTTGGGQHAPGSVGAAFQPNNVKYSAGSGPAVGSRAYRALPQSQRQGMLGARDREQAGGMYGNMLMSNVTNHANNTTNYANMPTAKGGLENIPARPAAHPLSKTHAQGSYPMDGEAMADNAQRQIAGMTPSLGNQRYSDPNDPFASR